MQFHPACLPFPFVLQSGLRHLRARVVPIEEHEAQERGPLHEVQEHREGEDGALAGDEVLVLVVVVELGRDGHDLLDHGLPFLLPAGVRCAARGKFESARGRTASERSARVDRDRSARRTQRCRDMPRLRYEAEDSRDAEMPGRGLQDGGRDLVGVKQNRIALDPDSRVKKPYPPVPGSGWKFGNPPGISQSLLDGHGAGSRRFTSRLAGMAFLGSRVERIWLRLGSQARAVSLAARNNGSEWPLTSLLRQTLSGLS